MKNELKVIIYITLVILMTFILCVIFIKPTVLNFKLTEDYEYIQNNKNYIDEIVIRNKGQLGENCYKLDIDKGYEILNNISIKKEIGFCSGSSIYIEFYFKDKKDRIIKFECENLFYDGKRYKLKEPLKLYTSDEYIPDKITKGMIIVTNENKIECSNINI